MNLNTKVATEEMAMLKAIHPALACRAVAFGLLMTAAMSATAQPGDMNCDGVISSADVPLFVDALLGVSGAGGCGAQRADVNGDTQIDGRDIAVFLDTLLAPPCGGHFLRCGGVCIDPWIDTAHCGGCGNACAGGENCVGGACQPAEPCPGC